MPASRLEEGGDPRLVGIVDDEFADARLEQRDGDRAARASGADEECPRSLELGAVVFCAFTKASPSSMSPCQVPSGLRRITLTTPSILARSELVVQ